MLETGSSRVLLVAGDPGIGKTRLSRELALSVASGAIVLAGRAEPIAAHPLAPVVAALSEHLRTLEARHRDELLAELDELGRFLPDLGSGLRTPRARSAGDPGPERARIFDELTVLLGRLADDRPVLFVLDDVHWADHATLLMLQYLVSDATPTPLMLVLTYRDSEIGRRHPLAELVSGLQRHGSTTRIGLRGLTGESVEQLISVLGEQKLTADDAEIAQRIHAETGGNPFFVTEVLRHLTESGVIVHVDGRWRLDVPLEHVGLPESVRDVIGRRLSALPEGADDVLQVIAVAGREADVELVIDVSHESRDAVLDSIDAATRSGLLVEIAGGDRVAFCHGIVREVVLGELTSARRRRLHEQVARALETSTRNLDDVVPELAMHWREAGVVGPAVRFMRRAAELALDRVAYEEAEHLLGEALELVPASETRARAELLLMIGRACYKAGQRPRGNDAVWAAAEHARELRDPELLADAALAYGGFWGFQLDPDDLRGHQLLTEALPVAPDQSRRAQLAASLASRLTPPLAPDERVQLTQTALSAVDSNIDPRAAASTYFRVIWAFEIIDDCGDSGLSVADDFLACATRLPDLEFLLLAHEWRGRLRLRVGDVTGANADLDVRDELAVRLRRPEYLWSAAMRRSSSALSAGHFDEVESEHIPAVVAAAASCFGDVIADYFRVSILLNLRAAQQRFNEVRDKVEVLSALQPTGIWPVISAVESDDRDALGPLLRHGIPESLPGDVSTTYLWPVYAARASVILRDTDSARALLPRFLRWPSAPAGFFELSSTGANAHWAGRLQLLLGDLDAAVSLLERALDVYAEWGHRAWSVHGAWDLAGALRTRGAANDQQHADELYATASADAVALGILAPLP
jgi:tetratricopeptide (TPR) repeat protein